MDQQPDTIGMIVGGILAGTAAVVAVFRRMGWKIFGPPVDMQKAIDDIHAKVDRIDRALVDGAVLNGRFDERLNAIDRRVEALEKR